MSAVEAHSDGSPVPPLWHTRCGWEGQLKQYLCQMLVRNIFPRTFLIFAPSVSIVMTVLVEIMSFLIDSFVA